MSRRRIMLLTLILTLLIPFPTTVVPEWKVRIIDQNGKPFVEESVVQTWMHYSLAWEGCCPETESRTTDENGMVVFPKRTIWAGLLQRIVFPLWASVKKLVHGSTGIHTFIMVVGYSTNGGVRDYVPDKPLPQEIILQR